MASSFWKILRDLLNREKAIEYAREASRLYKASVKVSKIENNTQKLYCSVSPKDSVMLTFETAEGRAKDSMFTEFVESNEIKTDDYPYVRITSFADFLDSDDGKRELRDLTRQLRKELH